MRVLTTSCAALCGALILAACGSNNKSGEAGSSQLDGSATGSTSDGTSSSSTSGAAVDGATATGFSAATSGSSTSGGSGGGGAVDTDGDGVADPVEGEGEGSAGAAGAGNEPVELEPGTLTAGIWDDNQNFDWFSGYYEDQSGDQLTGWFTSEDHQDAQQYYRTSTGYETLDIALVIDTTGSMGDELDYLQVEFEAISSAIEQRYANAEQRWSLVVYRDEQDDYVTRSFDFSSDLDTFRSDLGDQSHGGGGDFPEAPDRALEEMNLLDWRDDEGTLKLAFWVADAPHHQDDEESVDRITQAIIDAQEAGIRINPVASSGVDEFTEFTMRSTAQLTLGQYLFLTDDSGVGGEHKEPTVPCYYVTTLADALVRVVDFAMTGEPAPVDQNQVVRTVGKPSAAGVCALDGNEALAF